MIAMPIPMNRSLFIGLILMVYFISQLRERACKQL